MTLKENIKTFLQNLNAVVWKLLAFGGSFCFVIGCAFNELQGIVVGGVAIIVGIQIYYGEVYQKKIN